MKPKKFNMRLTDEEYELLRTKAEKNHMSMSMYIRYMLFNFKGHHLARKRYKKKIK